MKYLGVDYGSKKIGIAKSDEAGSFAFPYSIIENKKNMSHVTEILEICQKENINDVVLGKSTDYGSKDNPIEQEISLFIEKFMENSGLAIHRFDERMTTSGTTAILRHSFQKTNSSENAKVIREHTKNDDAKVAAYMLQGFLDMKTGI